ncbi:hypothetical protein GETHLI_33920 [Geothrix limicola]|uniref:DNA primase DNAG catalytic core N-terminal domain-containing protein n=1 Tax=Geothrix limicola TaxID=2927978 RepID=A0ABQ5QJ42_9BACT|nr:toprim domain-containing protein [Geothrix limicola]GLH74890.1 hypothetical protein GETHLI_33920 [Geothrix limicola]
MPRTTEAPISLQAEGQTLLRQVVEYYHETLKTSPEAMDYLKARGIHHPEAIERFRLGYANRSLGLTLPVKQLKAGAEIRGRLAEVGLYRESGHEHFNGSLVIPILDEAGKVVQVYGRKLLDNLRKGTPLHTYLPGPHRGVWNLDGLKGAEEVILAKSVMDALTYWCAGYRHVTAAYGVDGFTEDHLRAFQRHGTQRVLIAYESDEAGEQAALKVAAQLSVHGIACHRIRFPEGMDANSLALKTPPAAQALGKVIRAAEEMDCPSSGTQAVPRFPSQAYSHPSSQETRKPDSRETIKPGTKAPTHSPTQAPAQATTQATTIAPTQPPKPTTPHAAYTPGDDLPHEIQGQDLLLPMSGRTYRVRGWQKALNPEFLKVNLMVSMEDRFHIDSLDLYHAKARTAFIRQASSELGASEDALKLELGKVLRKVEGMQADLLAEALRKKDQRPEVSEEERAEALSLLKSPDLMRRVLHDFEALGVVGEESNKLTGYLAAVSRLLDRPLALLIQSASAAGKTSLMDAVLDFMPDEDLVRYSAMSGQSIFYMGDRNLTHKVLAIAEEEGARQASYALKLLQSEGRVTMASTGKNATTGMLETHDYTVEGPVMLFLTTTAAELDEELLNRCLVLTVDESREQTRAIHGSQRSRETLEGLLAKTSRDSLIALHRNAQRLLEPLAVVNPYADQLSFRDDQTRSRRDHVKYLTLIRSIALLHQFQREVRTLTHQGKPLRYIEVTPEDIALANDLAQEVLGRTLDELLPQTRKLLGLLYGWVQGECGRLSLPQADFRFTRRQIRESLGWGDTQLKVHLARLVEMELLLIHRGRQGKSYAYELVFEGEDADGRAKLLGLIDCGRIQAVTGRGVVGDQSGDGQGAAEVKKASSDGHLVGFSFAEAEKAPHGVSLAEPSNLAGVVR